jgi:hypothetical protein
VIFVEKKCTRRVNGDGTLKRVDQNAMLAAKVQVDVSVLDGDGLASGFTDHG